MHPRHRIAAATPTGHRCLALAVVRQAIADTANPAAPAAVRQSARRFLAGNGMFRFWSSVAAGKRQPGR
jgi:hypothetical protein